MEMKNANANGDQTVILLSISLLLRKRITACMHILTQRFFIQVLKICFIVVLIQFQQKQTKNLR